MNSPRLAPEDAVELSSEPDLPAELLRIRARRARDPILEVGDAAAVRAALALELPCEGTPIDEVLDELDGVTSRFARRNAHPGFFGYLCGPGLPTDPIAHALAGALAQNVTGHPSAPGPSAIENATIAWLVELAGLPGTSAGLFLSGGSLATFHALAAALRRVAGPDLPNDGLAAVVARRGPLALYAAKTSHFSVARAASILGLGRANVREIAVDARQKMIPDELARALDRDRDEGCVPVAVVATAGTTTLGAVDPLEAIASVCAARGVWLHVDAAYGGGVLLSREHASLLRGIERADSVAIDLHKWFFLAATVSALLMRDPSALPDAFAASAEYVPPVGLAREGEPLFFHQSLETSRPFRALPAWLALRHFGLEKLGRWVDQTMACAQHLAFSVRARLRLELVLEPELSVVCFRYVGSLRDATVIDAVNRALTPRLVAEGRFYLSSTETSGRSVQRVAILNPATTGEHIAGLLDDVLRLGAALEKDLRRP